MKTESEIRRHRDALRHLNRQPCTCGNQHAVDCFIGGKMMAAVESTLSWLLNENDGLQPFVDELNRGSDDKQQSPGIG